MERVLTIDKMFDKFNNSNDTEFEVRTEIDLGSYKALIEHFKEYPSQIKQTLNVITSVGEHSYIQTREFQGGVQKPTVIYVKKTRLLRREEANTLRRYKIVVSRESPITKAEWYSTDASIYRLKWRHSIIFDDWVIDITFSYQTSNITDLKTMKTLMFNSTNAPPEKYARCELEIERTKRPIREADMEFIEEVFNIIDSEGYAKIDGARAMRKMAKVLKFNSERVLTVKNMTGQVYDLTMNELSNIRPNLHEYYITDKADGERTVVFINNDDTYFINSKIITVENQETLPTTIIDTEMIDNECFAFDILIYEGKDMRNMKFEDRYSALYEFCKSNPALGKSGTIGDFKITAKVMIPLGDDLIKSVKAAVAHNKSRKYETDGYILTKNADYFNPAYKLKYTTHMSIDFLVIKAPEKLIGLSPFGVRKGETLYFLYVGISRLLFNKNNMKFLTDDIKDRHKYNGNYFPVHFATSSNPYAYIFWHSRNDLDGKICELTRASKAGSVSTNEQVFRISDWKLLRIREDRTLDFNAGGYFGNDYRIAENIWQSFENPVMIEDLYDAKEDYFKVHDNNIYRPVRSFNSAVKTELIKQAMRMAREQFRDQPLVCVDLGGGKGQDLGRHEADHTIFVDIDKTALQELITRKNQIKNETHERGRNKYEQHPMRISVLHADINQPSKITLNALRQFASGAHIIVCNMAIHYFVNSDGDIANFVELITGFLEKGGIFLYTSLDGERVFNLIKEHDWEVRDDTVLKFSIKKKFKEQELLVGQKIDIILPFSNDEYYEEPLVNIPRVNAAFTAKGFAKPIVKPFAEFNFNNISLDSHERQFVHLYTSVILINVPNKSQAKLIKSTSDARALKSLKKGITAPTVTPRRKIKSIATETNSTKK